MEKIRHPDRNFQEATSTEDRPIYVALVINIIIILVSCLSLVGEATGSTIFASWLRYAVPMAPITALLFICSGLALLATAIRPGSRPRRILLGLVGLTTCATALQVLSSSRIFYAVHRLRMGTTHPDQFPAALVGEMSPLTAFGFLLAGFCLLLCAFARWGRAASLVLDVCAVGDIVLGVAALAGYLHGTPILYDAGLVPIALPTAVLFILLGLAFVTHPQARSPLLGMFSGPSTRSRLIRAFVPGLAIVMLIVSSFDADLGIWLGIENPAIIATQNTIIMLLVSTALILLVAPKIGGDIDAVQAALALQVRRAEALLELPQCADTLDEVAFIQRGQEMYEDITGSPISFVHFINQDEESVELVAWSHRTLAEYCTAVFDKHYPVSQAGIWADALRKGQPQVFNDYPGYQHKRGLPAGHAELVRLITLPVLENGRVVMIAGVGNKPSDYTAEDVNTVQLFANLIWRVVRYQRSTKTIEQERLRLETILKTASDGIHILDSDGLLVEANDAFLSMLGYDRSAIGKLHISAWNDQDPWETIKARMDSLIDRHGATVFETRHRRSDGVLRDIEISTCAIKIEGRNYIYAASRDISARKQAAVAAELTLNRLQEAQRIARLGYWSLDLMTRELSWSDEVFRLFEIDPKQFDPTYETFLSAVHPDDRDEVNRSFTGAIANHTAYEITHRLLMRDGRIKWLHERGSAEFSADGTPLRAMGTAQDVTEMKFAEEQLRIAATAMESQEATVISNAAGVILRVNQAFAEITGYSTDEAVGNRTNLLKSGRHNDEFYRAMWQSINLTGTWRGEIWNRRKNGEVYPEFLNITAVKGAEGNVTHYVGTFSDISNKKAAEDRINELAFYDPLTHLPNRRLLMDRLSQALAASVRNEREGALLFFDLDNFKKVNDTHGHDQGDLLLQEVARRLTSNFRGADTMARIGGDEFGMVLADLSGTPEDGAAQAEVVGQKILAILGEPYDIGGNMFRSTPSIGITLFGDHRGNIDDLMKQADIAMYQAKAAGRNTLRFFDPELQSTMKARASLEADLHQGILLGQILVHYQPQVNGQGRLTGAEALVRWRHPERGLVSPAEFIPLAEETGLILAIGDCVLETGCNQIVAWANREETAHVTLAVNVSAHQFRQTDFVDRVLGVVNRTGANPQRLKLELTESMLVEDVPEIIAKMMALKARGISFSLDDFGTGYSSLAYLKRLPLDQLKIDQSFVRDVLNDPNDAAIARTIVSLGQSLGLDVIAEGVETAEQRDFLADSGCHAYQGYYFSRPLPLDAFDAYALKN